MAGSVNKVILIGNLGADPEVRRTQDGRAIANLRLATSESWRDKATGERREKTEWHRVVIFSEGLAKTAGNAQVLIAAAKDPAYYYCELLDGSSHFNATYTYDQSGYFTAASTTMLAPLAAGPLVMSLQQDPQTIACATTWPVQQDPISGPLPAGIAPNRMFLYVQFATIELDYFAIIETR